MSVRATHYPEVPEHYKWPIGPYHQAPEACGGEWWIVTPFTGAEPWLRECPDFVDPRHQSLPAGFIEIYGPRPKSQDFHDEPNPAAAFQVALVSWNDNLKHFKRAGWPEIDNQQQLADATRLADEWGLGEPHPFEGRYGFKVAFPKNRYGVPFFWSVDGFLEAAHLMIAVFQTKVVMAGIEVGALVPGLHPFLRDQMFEPIQEHLSAHGG